MTVDERSGSGSADAARAEHRRHRASAAFLATAVVALVVAGLAFWTDRLPDSAQEWAGFLGWRLAFLVLTTGLVTYMFERERTYRRMMMRLLDEHGRLAETDRARSDIVAMVTHELKTPLTSLLGYATIMRKRAGSLTAEQQREYLGVMEQQGERILHLIEELLQSSRLEAGVGKLQRAPLDLARLVRDISGELSVGRNRAIKVEVPDGDLGLFGDASAMEHVITNLIDNALKYSPEHTSVHVRIEERENVVLLAIRDEGIGIPPGDLPRIFERFQQSANSRGRASVGLGLYIVRNLVEAHGGRVWAESEQGSGATFTVALPRRRNR